jgi:hypothetical protein
MRKWKLSAAILAVGALLLLPRLMTTATAEEPNGKKVVRGQSSETDLPSAKASKRRGPPPVGTINYDGFRPPFQRDGQVDGMVGNRFTAPDVMDPHSIASVSFRLGGNFGSAIKMALLDVNPGSPGSVVPLFRLVASYLPSGTTATAGTHVATVVGVTTHTGSFIGGLTQSPYPPCGGVTTLNVLVYGFGCNGVALTEGTANAHGVRLLTTNYDPTTTTGTTGVDITGQNAIFRVTGSNLPVELMSFTSEN